MSSEVVLMGNNAVCKIIEIGTVQIRMHDDKVRILIDVRYILEMKKNLVFLGTLDVKRYKYSFEGGVMKVSRDALVAMKAKRLFSNLYVLQGATVIGSVAVSTSSISDSKLTKLWHMRLGYMGERGLLLLSKRGLIYDQNVGKMNFCKHYVLGKQKRVSFSAGVHRTKATLDYIHSNL